MTGDRIASILAVTLVCLFAAYGVVAWVRRRLARFAAARRGARARRGEREAEALLERHGYAVEARQVQHVYEAAIDGKPHAIALRVDLLVRRRGRRFVAEVKTGAVAPSIDHAPTRRQLLEYATACGADGVLLVCPEAGRIHVVAFPRSAPRDSRPISFALAIGAGMAIGFALAHATR